MKNQKKIKNKNNKKEKELTKSNYIKMVERQVKK